MLDVVVSPDQAEDSALMKEVADGDRQAFLHLYDKYASKVYGLALYILGDRMTAEEVTQDTFLRLWTRAATFNASRGKLSSWLLTITRRLALDRIRLDARRPRISDDSDPEFTLARMPDPASQTEEARWQSLKFALGHLPEEQRLVIELAFYQGMSHSQIAEYQQIPIGTVKTRMRLGMEKLRTEWDQGDKSN